MVNQSTEFDKNQIDSEKWLNRAAMATKDAWSFFRWFMWTKDEHDKSDPIKKFPEKAMYRVILRIINETDVLFVEKSRQIMMTWTSAGYFLWDALFHKGRLIAYQSKKQDDADSVIERMRIVYNELEKRGFPYLPAAKKAGLRTGTDSEIKFDENLCKLWGIPQGPDVVRSNTFSGILADECNHQPEFAKGYAAAKPCINGGGKYIAQGTANGKGSVYRLMYNIDPKTNKPAGGNVYDSDTIPNAKFEPDPNMSPEQQRLWIERKILELSDEEFESIPLVELVRCMPGMRLWQTDKGTVCLRVHYTADPDKDPITTVGAEWYRLARQSWEDADWEREMEINYDTYTGRPVIHTWSRDLYVRKVTFDPNYPLLMSNDYGTTCCLTFFFQYKPIPNFNAYRLSFLDEIVLWGSDTPTLAKETVNKIKSRFLEAWEYGNLKSFPDPAGNQARETTSEKSEKTSNEIMRLHGLKPDPKKLAIKESTDLARSAFALILPDGKPAVEVDPRCEYIIKCAGGGWHYPDKDDGIHDGKPEKDNEFDHGGDGIRHAVGNTFSPRTFAPEQPKPRFKRVAIRRHGRIIGFKTVFNQRRDRGVDNYVR